jgi:transcription initiation factor TFIIH subunit 4
MRKRLLENKPLIPTTISDQIRLWEMERDRIVDQEGMLYIQFNSANDFELIEKYAKDMNVLLWSSTQKRCIIVSKAGHDDVKRFWKMQRPKTSNEN